MPCAYPAYGDLSEVGLQNAFISRVTRLHTKLIIIPPRLRVDPSVLCDVAIRIASDKGHIKIVKTYWPMVSSKN